MPVLVDRSSNAQQRYATHGIFRFYGKYPPTSTRLILSELWATSPNGPTVDIMCGSGTTLVECSLAGRSAIGIDVNPLSCLISRVKTEKADLDRLRLHLETLQTWADATIEQARTKRPPSLFKRGRAVAMPFHFSDVVGCYERVMSRVERWFQPPHALQHAFLSVATSALTPSPEARAIRLAWLRTIRATSMASTRTGRLFRETGKEPKLPLPQVDRIALGIAEAQSRAEFQSYDITVLQESALSLSDHIQGASAAFWHPPYFALYKYSSDVMRLELEWMEVDRTTLARKEVRDGFKTSQRSASLSYLEDCDAVWSQLCKAMVSGGVAAAVNADSTLGGEAVGIREGFIKGAQAAGFQVIKVYERETAGTAAVYHRSSRPDIRTKSDFIVLVRKP